MNTIINFITLSSENSFFHSCALKKYSLEFYKLTFPELSIASYDSCPRLFECFISYFRLHRNLKVKSLKDLLKEEDIKLLFKILKETEIRKVIWICQIFALLIVKSMLTPLKDLLYKCLTGHRLKILRSELNLCFNLHPSWLL